MLNFISQVSQSNSSSTISQKIKSLYNTCFLRGINKSKLNSLTTDVVDIKKLTVEDCNFIRCATSDVEGILPKGFKQKPYKIATSGYSFDMEGYYQPTQEFLLQLDKKLGEKNTAYIAPPACDKGNIYDMTTRVSGLDDDKLLYVTSERYLKFLNPENFPEYIDRKKYLKKPIYVFPTPSDYADATANASNILVCTGGRKVAVEEIVLALKQKHKVVLLLNDKMENGVYNFDKDSVENTAKYFADITSQEWCKKHGYPIVNNLDAQWLKDFSNRVKQLVRIYPIDGSKESIERASDSAAKFIKETKTLYDYFPEDVADKMGH